MWVFVAVLKFALHFFIFCCSLTDFSIINIVLFSFTFAHSIFYYFIYELNVINVPYVISILVQNQDIWITAQILLMNLYLVFLLKIHVFPSWIKFCLITGENILTRWTWYNEFHLSPLQLLSLYTFVLLIFQKKNVNPLALPQLHLHTILSGPKQDNFH